MQAGSTPDRFTIALPGSPRRPVAGYDGMSTNDAKCVLDLTELTTRRASSFTTAFTSFTESNML
jgi:hypothetical protein